jgi:hypothetical protein
MKNQGNVSVPNVHHSSVTKFKGTKMDEMTNNSSLLS